MLYDRDRWDVAGTARQMAVRGLAPGTSGNVSARVADGPFVVTPTGMDHATLDAMDIVVVDDLGKVIEGQRAPTSELPMHLTVYRFRPEVRAIVHTHSPMATTVAVLGEDLPAVHYWLAVAGNRVRCAPYATYGSDQLAINAIDALGQQNAALLANHGVLAVGETLEEALTVAEAVEFVAGLWLRARAVGTPRVLDTTEMIRVGARFRSYGQPRDRTASDHSES